MSTQLLQKAAAIRQQAIHHEVASIRDQVKRGIMDKGTAKLHLDRLTREVMSKPAPSVGLGESTEDHGLHGSNKDRSSAAFHGWR